MISADLALRLHDAGLRWEPCNGDRFLIKARDMDDEVFVLSDMTIEVQDYAGGRIFKFNGTTEWALDSLGQDDVLWLPREDQLRAALGRSFTRLEYDAGLYTVELRLADEQGKLIRAAHVEAAEAYGLALLALIGASADAASSVEGVG